MRKAGKTAEKGKRICVPRVRAWPLFALLAAAPVLPLESPQQDFGDTVSVVNSFVRVLMPAGESPPWPSELELRWHGKSQRIVRIVGGPLATLELGIAVDESGSVYGLARDLRRVALGVMEGSVGEQDRTFLLGFGGRGEVLAEGRGEVDRVLSKLPTAPRAGATAFFDSLVAAIDQIVDVDVVHHLGGELATGAANGVVAAEIQLVEHDPQRVVWSRTKMREGPRCSTSVFRPLLIVS